MNFRLAAILILLSFSHFLHAADSTFNWAAWKMKWPVKEIDLNSISKQAQTKPFINKIQVVDMRYDTSNYGLFKSQSHQPLAIVSKTPIVTWINDKISDDPQGYNFIAVIKTLCFKDSSVFVYRNTKQIYQSDSINKHHRDRVKLISVGKLITAVDVFIQKEANYYPLVRLDSTFLDMQPSSKAIESLLTQMLSNLKDKMYSSILLNRYQNKKAATPTTIIENYSKVFQIPILKDKVVKNGVYLSWDQFKNNQPDTTIKYRFKTSKSEPTAVLTRNADGIEVVLQDVFAISETNHLYKIEQGNVYDMYRDTKSFYWMGSGGYTSKSFWIPIVIPLPGLALGGITSLGTKSSEWTFPYLLNVETGEKF